MAYTAGEISRMSYNEMRLRVSRGDITEQEIRKAYQATRKKAQNAINRIKKSDVGFTEGIEPIMKDGKKTGEIITQSRVPEFVPVSKIDNVSDLLKAFSDVNSWVTSAEHTVTQRRETRRKQLETLHEHKFDFVNEENIGVWGQFQEWFRATGNDIMYGSGDDTIINFFQENQDELKNFNPEIWQDLFDVFLDSKI